MSESRSRSIIALAAAYVIALQALLLPLSIAAGAWPDGSLCMAAASAASPQAPVGHATGCPCAAGCGMQCCAQALAGSPQAPVALAFRRAVRIAPPAVATLESRPWLLRPPLARAPPAA